MERGHLARNNPAGKMPALHKHYKFSLVRSSSSFAVAQF